MAAPAPPWVSTLTRALDHPPHGAIKVKRADLVAAARRLLPYQKYAVSFALSRGGRVLLGHEMGLGKTPMAIIIAAHCQRESGNGQILVVAPPVLLEQWRGTPPAAPTAQVDDGRERVALLKTLDVAGEKVEATASLRPMYDPKNERILQ